MQHLRIHTLYGGGTPAPFMFLGQMLEALRERRPFAMSSGRQLREYHHVDDDARAIGVIADRPIAGVIEVNHGAPLSLNELATGVFAGLGCERLLHVGALPDPIEDNYGAELARPAFLEGLDFRDTVAGVVHELSAQLSTSKVTPAPGT
ncbi:MAG: NAD(P)-dependent oxidoreductase [Comamonadaceae bacterium]|nr:MAG: NAD(P)-dependent oxidoreductase [Comamonadaceae bacterium]